MMRALCVLLLIAPAITLADQPRPRFDGMPVATPNFDDIPMAEPKKSSFDDKRVRECILKHLDKAHTEAAVRLVVRLCRAEHGY